MDLLKQALVGFKSQHETSLNNSLKSSKKSTTVYGAHSTSAWKSTDDGMKPTREKPVIFVRINK